MSQPLFTVIITTYNRQSELPQAIHSVLGQTDPDFELLLIDNGSTDDTESVVKAIADERLRYVRNPAPSRSCDAPRNLGIQLAQGELIAFLDDDDIWYPAKLEKVRRAFEAHPDAAAVCHHENRRIDGVLDRMIAHGPWSDRFFETLLYERNCLSPCALTIRTELLRRLGGFSTRPELDAAGDYELWLRMAAAGATIHFIQEPLGEFRATGSNISATDPAFGAKVAWIVKEHLVRYEGRPAWNLSVRGSRRLFELTVLAARGFAQAGRYSEVLRHLGRALLLLAARPALVIPLWRRARARPQPVVIPAAPAPASLVEAVKP